MKIFPLKTKAIIFLSLLFLGLFFFTERKCFADWQSDLGAYFDVVETFDNVKDWTPSADLCGRGDIGLSSTNRPQYITGGPTKWGYMSDWNSCPSGYSPVIQNHGSGKSVTGKSLRVDMSSSKLGVGRLGMYWGDGTPTSGHRDVYVFYRHRIPRNHFPTSTTANGTGVGTHIKGQSLSYIGYEKFFEITPGFTSDTAWNYIGFSQMAANDARAPYGGAVIVRNLYIDGGVDAPVERIASANYRYGDSNQDLKYQFPADAWARLWDEGAVPVVLDDWGAVEWHITLRSPAGNDSIEVWHYDANGNATKVGGANNLRLQEDASFAVNRLFVGGNSSITYGSGMDSTYYVDDIIVDGKRIGPTYFALLKGHVPVIEDPVVEDPVVEAPVVEAPVAQAPPPAPPSSLRVIR